MSELVAGARSALYGREFFDAHAEGSARSAAAMLPRVVEWVRPRSVVDVGCGEGYWLAVARSLGVEDVLGLDGDYVDRSRLRIPAERFCAIDLGKPFRLERSFDLVISMEVAEHLDAWAAVPFVKSLAALAPAVLFSAAIPGQRGTDHRNEQWPAYWATLFADCGMACFDAVRPLLWGDEQVEFWYRQNALLFLRRANLKGCVNEKRRCTLPVVMNTEAWGRDPRGRRHRRVRSDHTEDP